MATDEVKSSLETVDEVTRKFTVSIPQAMVTREVEVAMNGVAKTAELKGFRAGKAPRHLVEKMHGDKVRLDVANRLISSSLDNLVREHKLEVVGDPQVEVSKFEPGQEIEYTANLSVFPNPKIAGYEKFKVEVPKRVPTNEEIERVLTDMRQAKATLRKLEFRDTAQKGDVADASVNIEVEGEEPSRPEPVAIEVGEGKLPKELEEGIIGLKVMESKTIEGAIPSDHPNTELRGKKALYHVTLNGLSEKVLPEVDDAFAKTLNFGVETVLELKIKIRTELEQLAERDTKADVQGEILNQLEAKNPFQVPQVMVDDEIRSLLLRAGVLDPSKIDPRRIPMDSFRERFGESATKRVRTAIIVDRIGQQETIKPSNEDIDAAIADMAEKNGVTADEVRKFMLENDRLVPFTVEISRNKVLDFLAARAEVKLTEAKEDDKEAAAKK